MSRRKILVVMAALLLSFSAFELTFIAGVVAKHQAGPEYRDVYWTLNVPNSVYGLIFNYTYQGRTYFNSSLSTSASELYQKSKCIAFVVEANKTVDDDPIVRIDVILPQDQNGNALFHLKHTEILDIKNKPAKNWTMEILEVDPKQWIRSFRFKTDNTQMGIKHGNTYTYDELRFCMYFSEGVDECSYKFTIWTYDSNQEGHEHFLWLVMDKTGPNITITPQHGSTVNGLLAPCGRHYFTLVVVAQDNIPSPTGAVHDSGIKSASIIVYNATNINDVVPPFPYINGSINLNPGQAWTFTYDVFMTGRKSGDYNITVEVWDGVGNKNSMTIKFTYIAPPSPLTITPTTGYAALQTQVKDKATGLVASSQYTYKAKTLGTLVTLKGIQFGANLPVEVRVYIPTYHSYNRTYGTYNILVNITKTDSQGSFTATFIFPEAPAGIYNVTAKTSVMECAIWFEVKPEIIYEPDEVIGPALITVKATGFTAQTTGSWLFILPDALQGVNTQIDRWWYIDGNGTLRNALNSYGMMCEPPQTVDTTLNWPFMEPGTYTVEIKHVNGNYWDGQKKAWKPTPCFAGSNTIKVEDWTGDILNAANAAKSSADAAKSSADAAKSSADSAKSSADAAKSAAEGVKDSADKAKAAAEGLTIPVYLAVILSLIAAIAAAACTVLVYRKIA